MSGEEGLGRRRGKPALLSRAEFPLSGTAVRHWQRTCVCVCEVRVRAHTHFSKYSISSHHFERINLGIGYLYWGAVFRCRKHGQIPSSRLPKTQQSSSLCHIKDEKKEGRGRERRGGRGKQRGEKEKGEEGRGRAEERREIEKERERKKAGRQLVQEISKGLFSHFPVF